MIPSISVDQLLYENKGPIIDIRSIENYNNNHIPKAINIPYEELLLNPNKYLNKNIMYYIYCRSGFTSIRACKILINKGYRVTNINGGYESWLLKK